MDPFFCAHITTSRNESQIEPLIALIIASKSSQNDKLLIYNKLSRHNRIIAKNAILTCFYFLKKVIKLRL